MHRENISLSIFPNSHPGLVPTVHRHTGVFGENVQGGDFEGPALPADPGVHHHAEPLLVTLVAQRSQLKRSLGAYRSGQAVEGRELAVLANAASPLFGEATSDPASDPAILSTDT